MSARYFNPPETFHVFESSVARQLRVCYGRDHTLRKTLYTDINEMLEFFSHHGACQPIIGQGEVDLCCLIKVYKQYKDKATVLGLSGDLDMMKYGEYQIKKLWGENKACSAMKLVFCFGHKMKAALDKQRDEKVKDIEIEETQMPESPNVLLSPNTRYESIKRSIATAGLAPISKRRLLPAKQQPFVIDLTSDEERQANQTAFEVEQAYETIRRSCTGCSKI